MLSNIGGVQLLIVLAIVFLIFGTGRIRQAGSDLGAMIAGFRKEAKGEKIDTLSLAKDIRKAQKTINEAKKIVGG